MFQYEHNTRNKEKFKLPSHHTTKFEKSPFYNGVIFYNKLSQELRQEKNINVFKRKLKVKLWNKAYYNLKEFLNDSNFSLT